MQTIPQAGKKWFEKSYFDDDAIGGELQTTINFVAWNTFRIGVNFMEDNHKEGNYLRDECYNVNEGGYDVISVWDLNVCLSFGMDIVMFFCKHSSCVKQADPINYI